MYDEVFVIVLCTEKESDRVTFLFIATNAGIIIN